MAGHVGDAGVDAAAAAGGQDQRGPAAGTAPQPGLRRAVTSGGDGPIVQATEQPDQSLRGWKRGAIMQEGVVLFTGLRPGMRTMVECRGKRTLTEVTVATGISAPRLSELERGMRLPTTDEAQVLEAYYSGTLRHVVVPVIDGGRQNG